MKLLKKGHTPVPWLALLVAMLLTATSVSADLRSMDVEKKQQAAASVKFTINYRLSVEGSPSWVKLTALVPRSMEARQDVLGIDYSIPPRRIFDVGGRRYAEFYIENPARDVEVTIAARLDLHNYDLSSAVQGGGGLPAGGLADYLAPETNLESDCPEVVRRAAGIANGGSDVQTARRIFDYVSRTLRYAGYVPADLGVQQVLARQTGDCSDFTDVFVTLCRAKGIPARTIDGYLINYGNDVPLHTWSEIYTEAYGWVPVDPLLASLSKVSFERLRPEYIYLSDVRNDPVLANYHFYVSSHAGGRVSIKESYSVEHLPSAPGAVLAAGEVSSF
jgi:hypothetical protein